LNPTSATGAKPGLAHERTDSFLLGWDVGGAHLKAALLEPHGRLVRVVQLPCTLWTGMDQLHAAADALLATLPSAPMLHAITMTGEMADLFPDRHQGVRAIVGYLTERLQGSSSDRMQIYAGADGFIDAAMIEGHLDAIASANWIATAAWCARQIDRGILVDIGSTTTDLIPFADGRVIALGTSDAGRLDHGELAYLGVVRTPLMGMAETLPVAGRWRPAIKEYYASTADVFRLLDELDEACDVQASADNGPKSVQGSARRILRMIGQDLDPASNEAALALARWYRERLLQEIVATMHLRVSRGDVAKDAPLVGAGIGTFLIGELATRLQRRSIAIEELLCPKETDAQLRSWAAHCAPAVAVALLAHAAR